MTKREVRARRVVGLRIQSFRTLVWVSYFVAYHPEQGRRTRGSLRFAYVAAKRRKLLQNKIQLR